MSRSHVQKMVFVKNSAFSTSSISCLPFVTSARKLKKVNHFASFLTDFLFWAWLPSIPRVSFSWQVFHFRLISRPKNSVLFIFRGLSEVKWNRLSDAYEQVTVLYLKRTLLALFFLIYGFYEQAENSIAGHPCRNRIGYMVIYNKFQGSMI